MPTVAEPVALIHATGGSAVWAHPYWDLSEPSAVAHTLERYVAAGVDGVEAFYITHDAAQARHLVELAEARDLLMTGSADFHGPRHRLFSRFRAFDLHGARPRLGPIDQGLA